MFLGSVYEVLYENKLLKKRNLTSAEINEIYLSFWGNEGKEDSGIWSSVQSLDDYFENITKVNFESKYFLVCCWLRYEFSLLTIIKLNKKTRAKRNSNYWFIAFWQ